MDLNFARNPRWWIALAVTVVSVVAAVIVIQSIDDRHHAVEELSGTAAQMRRLAMALDSARDDVRALRKQVMAMGGRPVVSEPPARPTGTPRAQPSPQPQPSRSTSPKPKPKPRPTPKPSPSPSRTCIGPVCI